MKLMRAIYLILAFLFLSVSNTSGQDRMSVNTRASVSGSIPSDNTLRYYRLAIPVTRSAYVEDLDEDYNNVLQFWRDCEEFANRMFVPLGICFDVVEDQRLVKTAYFTYEEDVYTLQANGTTNTNDLIGADSYDVGMWVHHRDLTAENSGLSAEGGVYSSIAKGSGYSKTDKWVVAHELGHMFGAPHTTTGEGSLMDSGGDDFFSYPSIKKIRDLAVEKGAGSAYNAVKVSNSAPVFNNANMKDSYRIPQGACIAIPVYANDTDGHMLTYSAIGCSSSTVGNIIEGGDMPHFASVIPQTDNIIDYRPKFTADIYYDDFYYEQSGTNIPAMSPGSYNIAILVNDIPSNTEYGYLVSNPFYSNYAVWDATVQIVGGTSFNASMSPAKNSYSAGEQATVSWGVNSNYFTADSRLRITMSTDYGKTFAYVLADDVPALDGSKAVTLPDINVGNIDVDFKTATRSMRGGIIRVEEIGGVAYTLTTLSPENGGGFNITGGGDEPMTYTINVTAGDGGTATIDGKSSATVDAGSSVTLTATPSDGYIFDAWYSGGRFVSLEAEYTFTPTASGTYNALFEKEAETPVTYKITATANPIEGGTATVNGGTSATVEANGTIELSAKANDGYTFVNWTSGGKEVTTQADYKIYNVTGDADYVANFKEEAQVSTYTITVSANPAEGGTATVNGKASVEVEANGTIELSAKANDGYTFVNWTSGGKEVTIQADYKVYNVAGDADYIANFKEEGSGSDPQPSTGLGGKWYRIKDNASGKYIDINKNGATDRSHGNVIMSDKDEDSKRQIIYFETSGDGYKLKAATGDYIKCEQWNVSAGDANSAATLIFEETGDFYYIKWNHTYYQNNIYYFKVVNAEGGDKALHPYDDAENTSIAAKWTLEEVKYTISVSASEGGTAEVATGGGGGAASVEVPYDGSATLTATPASGFKFVNWTKGGTLFSEEAELTVNNIQANAEYVANFEQGSGTINPELDGYWFRIRKKDTDLYMNIANNYDNSGSTSGVTVAAKAADGANQNGDYDSDKQVFEFQKSGNGYKLKSKGLHYIGLNGSNVNASSIKEGAELTLEYTGQGNEYCIMYNEDYFNTQDIGGGTYLFCKGNEGTVWVLEEVEGYNFSSSYKALRTKYEEFEYGINSGSQVGDYTEECANTFNAALSDAKNVLSAANSTDSVYSTALEDLTKAEGDLWKIVLPEKNKYYVIRSAKTGLENNRIYAGSSAVPALHYDNAAICSKHVFTLELSQYGNTYLLKSLERGTYLSSLVTEGNNTQYEISCGENAAKDVTIARLSRGSRAVSITPYGGKMFNAGPDGKVVGYDNQNATSGSAWFIDEVDLDDIHFDVTMKTKFSSVTLGYNATVPAGVEAYNAVGLDDGYVSLVMVAGEGDVIPANTPVILYRTDDESEAKTFRFTYTDKPADKPASTLLGGSLYTKYVECDNSDYYKLMIKNGEAKMYLMYKEFDAEGNSKGETHDGGHIKCGANKIYMRVPGGNETASFGMRFVDYGTTDIDDVKGENGDAKTIYDLQGRKLTEITEPGFYIVDGKRVYVK